MKVIFHLLGIGVISILLCIIYYLFFSEEKYSGQTQYLPSFIFSFLVLLCFVLAFLYAKKWLELKWSFSIIIAVLAVVLLFVSSNVIHSKYGYMFQHYYSSTPYGTLFALPQYAKETGNYITVKRAYQKDYGKVKKIREGSFGEGESDHLQAFLVNEENYIVIDWQSKTVVTLMSKGELEEIFINQVRPGNIESITHNVSLFYVIQDGNATNYMVLPTSDGFLFPTLKKYQGR